MSLQEPLDPKLLKVGQAVPLGLWMSTRRHLQGFICPSEIYVKCVHESTSD